MSTQSLKWKNLLLRKIVREKGKPFAKAFPLKLDCFLEDNAEFDRLIDESLKSG